MIFGKIDYLNLLPFHVFIKRHMRSSRLHSTIHYKKGVPSQINAAFKKRRVDAAFISSIESKKYNCLDLGIVAKKEVLSVLLIPGEEQKDAASASSNALAQKLGLKGRVLIGDAALRYYLSHQDAVDMASVWYEKHRLPFVFARLCFHKKGCYLKKLGREFLKHPTKIPYYQLKKASQKSGIPVKDIQFYLTKISYHIDPHGKKALKKFL